MYVIYNRDEEMYLTGTQNRGLGVLTCLWGTDLRDALVYEDAMDARLLLRKIGNCNTEIRRVKTKRDGAQ